MSSLEARWIRRVICSCFQQFSPPQRPIIQFPLVPKEVCKDPFVLWYVLTMVMVYFRGLDRTLLQIRWGAASPELCLCGKKRVLLTLCLTWIANTARKCMRQAGRISWWLSNSRKRVDFYVPEDWLTDSSCQSVSNHYSFELSTSKEEKEMLWHEDLYRPYINRGAFPACERIPIHVSMHLKCSPSWRRTPLCSTHWTYLVCFLSLYQSFLSMHKIAISGLLRIL